MTRLDKEGREAYETSYRHAVRVVERGPEDAGPMPPAWWPDEDEIDTETAMLARQLERGQQTQ